MRGGNLPTIARTTLRTTPPTTYYDSESSVCAHGNLRVRINSRSEGR